ncbi:hypothetical protein Clacol_005606 [Clathrus columnatus]|uniref:Thymidylate kinase n=1 Tax=Clathrus columnatus TaxID=1419009 RepID=A0AAV5ADV8_9AGAM|nr:hypothetical protein Clacol_005606 [Clathrus columnatus]
MSRRGAFIVVEGLDRSGKTTQTNLLCEHLSKIGDRPVKLIKFPDRTTPIGQMIDNYLRSKSELDDHAIHLLFSANRWEMRSSLLQLLNEGITVICDRYAFSGVAFTFAKSLVASAPESTRKLTYEWCRTPDAGLPAPDLILFLDISAEVAKLRGGYGDERYEKAELQQRVREVYKRIQDDMQTSGVHWISINASHEMEVVKQEICSYVKDLSNGVNEPIKSLWLT